MADSSGAPAAILEPKPTVLNRTTCGAHLEVASDQLSVKYVGPGANERDIGAIQADAPVPRRCLVHYWEVAVAAGGSGRCSVAVGFSDAAFKKARHPGYDAGTYGYHSESGRRHHGSALRGEPYGPSWGTGDTVGVGFLPAKGEVFFTKNGQHLGTAFRSSRRAPLYPTLGLHSPGAHVTVNFGASPFAYDLAAFERAQRAEQAAEVARVDLPLRLPLEYVLQYLQYHGYRDTLHALRADDAAAVLPPSKPLLLPLEAAAAGAAAAAAAAGAQPMEVAEAAAPGAEAAAAAAAAAAVDAEGDSHMADGGEPAPDAAAAGKDAATGLDGGPPREDPAEAAATAAAAAEKERQAEEWLAHRARLRGLLLAGDVLPVMRWLDANAPAVVPKNGGTGDGGGGGRASKAAAAAAAGGGTAGRVGGAAEPLAVRSSYTEAGFELLTQRHIELIRAGDFEAAVAYAQSVLPDVRGLSAEHDARLMDVVALLAYPDPLASPLAWLLGQERRAGAAAALNLALLEYEAGGAAVREPALPRALRQLAAVQGARHEANWGQGEAFKLEDHLAPPPPAPDPPRPDEGATS